MKDLKHTKRRLALALLTLATMVSQVTEAGESYPDKPMKFIVPFPAGSGTDQTARLIGNALSAKTGQPVIVENKPGASGVIGAQAAAGAKPDGYTVLITTNTTHAANPAMFKRLSYDPVRDFEPVSLIGTSALVLLVAPNSPYKTVHEFLADLRTGRKTLTFGAGSSSTHVAAELLKLASKGQAMAVPYKGTPPALTDLIGGQLDFMFVDLGPAMPMIQSGRLRPLATTGDAREPLLPQIPTLAEAGIKDYQMMAWVATFVPARTPKPIVAKLNELILAAVADPSFRDQLSRNGARSRGSTPDELREFMKAEIEKWATTVKAAGIEPE
jgi:tripartite-type tricarboxylate transporter receptor subunit TctC